MRRLFRNQVSFALAATVLYIITLQYCTEVYCQQLEDLNEKSASIHGFLKPYFKTPGKGNATKYRFSSSYKKFGKNLFKSISAKAANILDAISDSFSETSQQDNTSTHGNYFDETLQKSENFLTHNFIPDAQDLGNIKKRENNADSTADSEKRDSDSGKTGIDELFTKEDLSSNSEKSKDSSFSSKKEKSKENTLPLFSIFNNLKLIIKITHTLPSSTHTLPSDKKKNPHVENCCKNFT